MIQRMKAHCSRLVILPFLHDIPVGIHESRLQVGMRFDRLYGCVPERFAAYIFKFCRQRDIVLGRLPVHLPVDEHAPLVLREGIQLPFLIRPEPGPAGLFPCIDLRGEFPDRRIFHDVGDADMLPEGAADLRRILRDHDDSG